ncbi:MAG: ribbon-helix-helix domain-containing protein [Pseudonocardia sp.]|nr:ribbon-helix-helix domain-containing protein [Pseudonocardia sp.]
MTKTTIYLPEQLKRAVTASAHRRGISEAELIRKAVAAAVAVDDPTRRGPVFSSDVLLADDVDVHLAGFGQR